MQVTTEIHQTHNFVKVDSEMHVVLVQTTVLFIELKTKNWSAGTTAQAHSSHAHGSQVPRTHLVLATLHSAHNHQTISNIGQPSPHSVTDEAPNHNWSAGTTAGPQAHFDQVRGYQIWLAPFGLGCTVLVPQQLPAEYALGQKPPTAHQVEMHDYFY